MQVAKLVPEVALAQRGGVGHAQVWVAGQRGEHGVEWLARGSWKPVSSPLTARRPRSGAITKLVALAGVRAPLGVGHSFDRSHAGGADRDHAPASRARSVHRPAVAAGTRKNSSS